MTREKAVQATRIGAIAAAITAIATLAVYILARSKEAYGTDPLAAWNEPLLLIDAGIIFILAAFMFRQSRLAAVMLFVYFLFTKVLAAVMLSNIALGIATLVFLLIFGRTIQGAFAFHKIEKQDNPNYERSHNWALIPGALTAYLIFAMIGLGSLTMTGFAPSTEVQTGPKVHETHIGKLIEAKLIAKRRDVRFFYSAGYNSVLEEGVILSSEYITVYSRLDDGDFYIQTMNLEDITSVEEVTEGGFWEDATYELTSQDPEDWMYFGLSVEENGHKNFMRFLRSKVVEKPKEKTVDPDDQKSNGKATP